MITQRYLQAQSVLATRDLSSGTRENVRTNHSREAIARSFQAQRESSLLTTYWSESTLSS